MKNVPAQGFLSVDNSGPSNTTPAPEDRMNRRLSFLVPLVVVFLLASSLVVRAEVRAIRRNAEGRRVALVIGNSDYPNRPLANPAHDAEDMAEVLKRCGFEVTTVANAGRRDLRQAVINFSDKLKKGGIGLFFYAGHGIQMDGQNYLVPVDADVKRKFDVEDQCLRAEYVLAAMEDAGNGLNLVVLDACRDNPFRSLTRSVSSGLATMKAPTGSLIAYSTAPGEVAADGEGRNGLYTQMFLKHILTPGLGINDMLMRVRQDVKNQASRIGNKQIPWETSSLTGQFYFIPAPAESDEQMAALPAPTSAGPGMDAEALFWQSVMNSKDKAEFEAYLRQYPTGRFANLAKIRMEKLQGGGPMTVAAMSVGDKGWAKAEAVFMDKGQGLWLRPESELAAEARAGFDIFIQRTAAGYIVDLTKCGASWEPVSEDVAGAAPIAKLIY